MSTPAWDPPRLRVAVLVGTRPDAVKLAPVVAELKRRADSVETVVLATGQHREMLDQVLDVFGVKPHGDLNLMAAWQGRVPSLAEITSVALIKLDAALADVAPDVLVVQGDTSTAFTGALAAFYHKIPVAHVEAGLRTHQLYDPFPEEANRHLISTLAAFHFAPTTQAAENLRREGVPSEHVAVCGNTVVDALQGVVRSGQLERAPLPESLAWLRAPGQDGRVLLVTLHRRENWGSAMAGICRAVRRAVDETPDVRVVFPLHRNPIVREVVVPALGNHPRIYLTEPLDYVSFLYTQYRSHFVVTDSGGVQEEAPAFGKPVLVLRETTERPEGVAAGVARLVGTAEAAVYGAVRELLDNPTAYDRMAHAVSPYGDGHASERIVDALVARVAPRNR